jgi:hypothetical protein
MVCAAKLLLTTTGEGDGVVLAGYDILIHSIAR